VRGALIALRQGQAVHIEIRSPASETPS